MKREARNCGMIIVLGLLALAISPAVRADSTNDFGPLGIVNATVGLTPMEDNGGLGRLFLSYVLDGNFNAFVFWISSSDPTGEPFTVTSGQFTFLPGTYDHFVQVSPSETELTETLTITPTTICCADVFSINRGEYLFDLPSTVTPTLNPDFTTLGGDEYHLTNVPVLVSNVPPLPEPGSMQLLGVGLGLIVAVKRYICLRKTI